MTIWILALLLFVLLALVGYNQGAIRVAVSLVGLILSSLMAVPLSRVVAPLVKGLFGAFSVDNPVLVWAIAPVVTFIILMILFKVAGLMAHKKVEVFYKYKAGDLRLALWERMNKRLGACLGVTNALVYLLLLSLVVYVVSYGTIQMAVGENNPRAVRLINRLGRDVVSTGLAKAVRVMDPAPQSYYEAADILGLVYHNPLTQGRLASYPAFLGLAERPEFQDLGNDKEFLEMLVRQAPVMEVINHPKTQAMLHNPDLLREIWALVGGNLRDFHDYIQSGQSAKYSEPLLGRWTFDTAASVAALKKSKPGISALELKRLRLYLVAGYAKAGFVAMPDHQAILKNIVAVKPGMILKPEAANDLKKLAGQWQNTDSKYSLTVDGREMSGLIENDKLKLTGDWTPVVFSRED